MSAAELCIPSPWPMKAWLTFMLLLNGYVSDAPISETLDEPGLELDFRWNTKLALNLRLVQVPCCRKISV